MIQKILRKTVYFVLAAIMCVSAYAPVEIGIPAIKNENTGNYFLPDYGKTLVASHRAGRGAAPENTMMSIKATLESPVQPDIFEMDLEMTLDGEIVLYHSLFLDEMSNAAEEFGHKNTPVFLKKYADIYKLNMGEEYFDKSNGTYPYKGLRGDDIPEDLRITKIEDVFDTIEGTLPGKYHYILEIKYPAPLANKMLKKLYGILEERGLCDKVIIGSFWPSVSRIIDRKYSGKLMRSANPLEIIDFYGCYRRNLDLSKEKFKYMSLQLPYYWKHGKLTLACFGETGLIDYAHQYGISVQYWTVNRSCDVKDLYLGGADVIIANHVDMVLDTMKLVEQGKY